MPSRKQLRDAKQSGMPVQSHHWVTRLVGTIALIILLFCSLAQTTVLNERFMTKELVNSSLANEVQNDINANLSSYGIQGRIVTTDQTNKLLKQAIHQVYQDEPIQLNTSDVVNSIQNRAGNTLSKYGISSSLVNSVPTSSISNQLASILNNRLNTKDVAKLENDIHVARTITIIGLVTSIIILVLLAVRGMVTKSIVADFRWMTLISGIVSVGVLSLIKPANYASSYASFSSSIMQVSRSILKIGWQMVCIDIIIAVLLFIIGLFFKRGRA
ncbi:hypothetical protein [uncultured Limosilactobacillus sp.]|uniref:hypothetical protein n=1 Tax=uncultured Limosilactobacillus sp. TaxID=2837629 RepID=UPI0025E8797E|nr:hypothetical protein [uncultured Limosilactobacillus sp.]